ncbi:hypothetical protein HK105_207680 [Polyrhizophydium stewartii]|uniref:THUMP domain-containing protein n=1 Tax=Polyrhizophydium stewartii TaxID=2732419 RepID=A0ABR4MZT2_9FUNG
MGKRAKRGGPSFSKTGAKIPDKVFTVEPGMSGILFSCHRNKEKQSTSEVRSLFNQYAEEIYPEHGRQSVAAEEVDAGQEGGRSEPQSIEDALKAELAELKDRGSKKYLFFWEKTGIDCLVFMRTVDPVQPVEFVTQVLDDLQAKQAKRTRFTSRIIPLSHTCFANPTDMTELARRVIEPHFSTDLDKAVTYAIIAKTRNNDKVSRDSLIQTIAPLVPAHHKVDLSAPELCIIVEVFKSICGMSVVRDYYRLRKFNLENQDGSASEIGRAAQRSRQDRCRLGA